MKTTNGQNIPLLHGRSMRDYADVKEVVLVAQNQQ